METAEPEVTQAGRYRIERTLGAGGMGIVYLAQDSKLDRPVAIKKLRKDAASENARARIHTEAQLLAKLNHRNIVQLYDVLEEDGNIALVMEYVEGVNLREWIREHSASLRQKLELLMQICEGLTQAHALGIVHRDLKPDNILISSNGAAAVTAKITDFGIAKSQQQDLNLTREDHVAGTVTAMSPEQIQGKPLDPRSDLFSLGVIAYELLCGAKPFAGGDSGTLALANRIVSEPHAPPEQAWAQIPEPLAALLDNLLGKSPEQRPASAQLVHEALQLLHRQGLDTDTQEFTATLTELLTRPRQRARRRLAAAAALLIATAATATGGWWGWKQLTRLPPQYIAVLPVQIEGEAPPLTDTLVRQALTSAATQLKSSALVAFDPKPDQDMDGHLKELRERGVTDALNARLSCQQVRCEVEIERLGPEDKLLKGRTGFTILTGKRQESSYQIAGAAAHLFDRAYHRQAQAQVVMGEEDYSRYLEIVARLDSKDLEVSELRFLEELLIRYPDNVNLYRAHTHAATSIFVASDNIEHIKSSLAVLEHGRLRGLDKTIVLELELWLRTYSTDQNNFERILSQLKTMEFPSAQLLSNYSRLLYTRGDYQAGIKYANEAAELNPSAENFYLIAMNHFGKGSYEDAVQILTKITELFPEHWASYATLGAIYIETGSYEAAESMIKTIPIALRSWRTHSNLGVAHFLQGEYEDALSAYLNAIKIAPNNLLPLNNIAEVYLINGDEQKAREYFLRIEQLTLGKTGIRDRIYRSLALAYLGHASESITLAHQLNRESPHNTDVKYYSAQIYALAGEARSASIYIEQLLDQNMSADWFSLPAFRQLCTQVDTTKKVADALCH